MPFEQRDDLRPTFWLYTALNLIAGFSLVMFVAAASGLLPIVSAAPGEPVYIAFFVGILSFPLLFVIIPAGVLLAWYLDRRRSGGLPPAQRRYMQASRAFLTAAWLLAAVPWLVWVVLDDASISEHWGDRGAVDQTGFRQGPAPSVRV